MFRIFVIRPQGVLNVLDWNYLWYFCVRSRCLAAWFFGPVVCVSTLYQCFKRQLKTPTCFGSFVIHPQGVLNVLDWNHLWYFCVRSRCLAAWNLDLWCVCTRHTHHRSKKSRCQTPTTHTKISQVISVKHVQHSLRMDHKGSETCRSF